MGVDGVKRKLSGTLSLILSLSFSLYFSHSPIENMGRQKICTILAFEVESKFGVIRGFQKGITLGSRTSRSALKVSGGWVGVEVPSIIVSPPVQSCTLDFGL